MYKRLNILLSVLFMALFVSVCTVQYLLYEQKITAVSNFDDGKRISAVESSVYSPVGEICLKVSDENIKILINGSPAEWEEDAGGIRKFAVNDGDVFHADLRNVSGNGVIFVYSLSGNITYPKYGSKIPVSGGVVKIFTLEISP